MKAQQDEPEPMVETDTRATLLRYDPKGKLPIPVMLVWLCAFAGLGVYTVTLCLPNLAP